MADYDYASAQSALARKRKLAEMLQQQAFAPAEMPTVAGAKLSPWTIAIKAMMGGMAGYQADKADADAKADAAQREAGATEQMGKMPVTIPGVDAQPIEQEKVGPPAAAEVPPPAPGLEQAFGPGGMPGAGVPPKDNEFKGSGSEMAAKLLGGLPPQANPLAAPAAEGPPMLPQGPLGADAAPPAPEGPPLLPQNPLGAQPFALPEKKDMSFPGMIPKKFTDAMPAQEPAPQDWLKWSSGLSKFGPEYADIGKEAAKGAIKAAMPMSADQKAQNASLIEQRVADREARIEAAKAAAANTKLSIEERALASKRHDEMLRENAKDRALLRQVAAGSGDKGDAKGKTVGDASDPKMQGWRVKEDSKSDRFAQNPETGEWVPYRGDVIPQSVKEKEILKATDAREAVASATGMVTMLEKNPDAYGFTPAALSKTPGGQWLADKFLTENQRTARAGIQREMSVLAHSIFGSAFTTGEQKTASQWLILPDDPAPEAYRKMKAMQAYAEDRLKNRGTVATAASEQRNPGIGSGAAPTKAPAAPAGKVRSLADINNDPKYAEK